MAGDDPAAVAACDRVLLASRVGLRLTTPWRVAVVGPVNAGKSSLVNALAGHARSIVSAVPGTTRDLVVTRLVVGGWEIDLVDTAGLRPEEPRSAAERAGIGRTLAVQTEVDLVIRVTAADQPDAGTAAIGACRVTDGELVPGGRPPAIDVLSKIDLIDRREPARMVSGSSGPVLTSAVTGRGIDQLASRIVAALVPEETTDPALLAGGVPFTPALVALVARLRDGGIGRVQLEPRP